MGSCFLQFFTGLSVFYMNSGLSVLPQRWQELFPVTVLVSVLVLACNLPVILTPRFHASTIAILVLENWGSEAVSDSPNQRAGQRQSGTQPGNWVPALCASRSAPISLSPVWPTPRHTWSSSKTSSTSATTEWASAPRMFVLVQPLVLQCALEGHCLVQLSANMAWGCTDPA